MKITDDLPRGKLPSSLNTTATKTSSRKRKRPDSGSDIEEEEQPKKFKLDQDHDTLSMGLSEDLLCLGVVKRVGDMAATIALPFGAEGKLPMFNICEAYSTQLKNVGDTKKSLRNCEGVAQLDDLLRVGQVVHCKVVEKLDTTHAVVSVDPATVNSNVVINRLVSGMVLPGCVKGVEDHGYTIDLGLKNMSTFVSKNDLEQSPALVKDLKVGRLLNCLLDIPAKQKKARIVKIILDQDKVEEAMAPNIPFSSLVPGMLVEAVVTQVLSNGVAVKCAKFNAVIPDSHLDSKLSTYEVEDEVEAAILSIHPLTKSVVLTQLPHLLTSVSVHKSFSDLSVGDLVKNAAVVTTDKSGVTFDLGNGVTGHAMRNQLSDKFLPDLGQKFAVGTKHKCRVVDFNLCEGIAIVTLKKSRLTGVFISYETLQVGQIVTGTIKSVTDLGLKVYLDNGVYGFVPRLHLANVPIENPDKMFAVNSSIKCRVLELRRASRKLLLTRKKSFLQAKEVVSSYSQLTKDMIVRGVILSVNDNGVVLGFFNGVRGFVYKDHLSTQTVDDPVSMFIPGQLVKARVLDCFPAKEKLRLSFKLQTSEGSDSKPDQPTPDDFEVGKAVSGVVTEILPAGLKVVLEPSGVEAILPTQHLSDHCSACPLLLSSFSIGDRIEDMIYLSHKKCTLVSRKRSLVLATQNPYHPKDLHSVIVSTELSGFVSAKKNFGIFVDCLHDIVGLVPNKYIVDERVGYPADLFEEGQSVRAHVMEVLPDSKLRLSVRLKDCYHPKDNEALPLLWNYLQELVRAGQGWTNQNDPRASLSTGHMVQLTVGAVTPEGVTGELDTGVKGLVPIECIQGVDCVVGASMSAMVLYVTVSTAVLSIDPQLITAITETSHTKPTMGQVLKAVVVTVTTDFAIVHLNDVARLAYLPVRKILNDVLGKRHVRPGQPLTVSLQGQVGDQLVVCKTGRDWSSKHGQQLDVPQNSGFLADVRPPQKWLAQNAAELPAKKKRERVRQSSLTTAGDRPTVALTVPFIWTDTLQLPQQQQHEDDDEVDDEDQAPQKKDKMKKMKKFEIEAAIREREQELLEDKAPDCVEDHEKEVVNQPDSSIAWIRFIAFYLEQAEIEKARKTAEKAIETINYRDEEEKMNLWIAYCNLELSYGSPDRAIKVFQRALRANDPLTMYLKMAQLYHNHGHTQEAYELYQIVQKKFRTEAVVWTTSAHWLYREGRLEEARALLGKALGVLPKVQHEDMVSRFALLELEHDRDYGTTMMEKLLAASKRTDIWSVYLDHLIKSGAVDDARRVLQKAANLLPEKKQSLLMKKFISQTEIND